MPVSYTYAFDEDLAANLRLVLNTYPREQAYKNSTALTMLEKRKVSLQGHYIQVNVSHVGTQVGGPYTENSVMSTVDVESGKVAQFEPAFYAEPARISRPQEKKAGGSKALFNLWSFKVDQARKRLRQKMATDLFATSQVANGITGLPLAIPATVSSGTWGGLDRSTYTWWRNYTQTSVGAFTSNGVDGMDLMELGIQVDGGEGPDFYVTTSTLFQKMKKNARSTINFEPTYKGRYAAHLSDMGIESISFCGKPVVWDAYCDSGKIYAITNSALYLGIYEDWDVEGPFYLQGAGTHAKVMWVYWGGQLLGEEARRLGQMSGVS